MITPISVSKTLAAKDKLFEKVLSNYIGAILAGEIFGQFVLDVRDVLGDTCDKTAVLNSLRVSAGLELTAERAEEISWRLAGNLHRLRKGAPVMPWREQTVKEWVPVEVVNVVKHKRSYKASTPEQAAVADKRGNVVKRGANITLLFQGGMPAGRTETKFWSMEYCQRVRSALGFDKFNRVHNARRFSKRNSYLFLDIRELFGRRFQVLLDPAESRQGELSFSDVSSTSASLKWSRQLHLMRQRVEFTCPKGYADEFDCFQCPIGVDQCVAACHRATFTTAACPSCERECYFDSDRSSEVCVDCWDNGR